MAYPVIGASKQFGFSFFGFGSPLSRLRIIIRHFHLPLTYFHSELKRMNMRISAITVFHICMAVSLTACGKKEKQNTAAPLVVNTAVVKESRSLSVKEYPFIAAPYRTSELSFRVGGPIDRFDVYAGNYYQKGELIAGIDSRDFCLRKERAEALYNQAKAEFSRVESLYRKNNLSASAFEKARAEYATARTSFESAINELDDTHLKAPFNGYVSEVYIEKFQDIKPTMPVVSFIDIDQLKIEAYVTQDIAFKADALNSVTLRFDASPDQCFTARVKEISKNATRNNLSYLLTAVLPNPNGKFLAGMSGKLCLEMISDSTLTQILIPRKGLCHRPSEGDYVWIIDERTGKAEKRRVRRGDLQSSDMVEIISGLHAGETIAVSGLRFLSEGLDVAMTAQKSFSPVMAGK